MVRLTIYMVLGNCHIDIQVKMHAKSLFFGHKRLTFSVQKY